MNRRFAWIHFDCFQPVMTHDLFFVLFVGYFWPVAKQMHHSRFDWHVFAGSELQNCIYCWMFGRMIHILFWLRIACAIVCAALNYLRLIEGSNHKRGIVTEKYTNVYENQIACQFLFKFPHFCRHRCLILLYFCFVQLFCLFLWHIVNTVFDIKWREVEAFNSTWLTGIKLL